jgi:Domain of unknown function (DUF6468)
MTRYIPLAIELLVSVLLVATIVYCMILNRRIVRFKADEQALKATIGELITATEIAERAIAGLKLTVRDCEGLLGEKLKRAEALRGELDERIETGDRVVARVGQIVQAARPSREAGLSGDPQPVRDPRAMAQVAQSIAERVRQRVGGVAA